jgi:hypothetical protein
MEIIPHVIIDINELLDCIGNTNVRLRETQVGPQISVGHRIQTAHYGPSKIGGDTIGLLVI